MVKKRSTHKICQRKFGRLNEALCVKNGRVDDVTYYQHRILRCKRFLEHW